jgi:glycerol kinase
MNGYVIALDQGTTSSRAIVFDALGNPVSPWRSIRSPRFIPSRVGWSTTP